MSVILENIYLKFAYFKEDNYIKKIRKIVMTFILTSALYTCVLPTSIVHATEFPVAFRASNPYPEHSWINLGTITLDSVTINNAIDVRSVFLTVLGGIVGSNFGAIGATLVSSVSALVNKGHTKFYIRLTQYVSTDYQWHYYSYTVYEDAKCTKKVGSYTSQKWKDRYARKLMELGLSMLSLS